ncbi:hypothetical protein BG006_005956 [Podila minutissima]|uniref:WD40 repeat-like protein n=1 Tax=Podila minutissima TaxID=64525 RepID=A0A9P5SNA6_9FUNG|nr:hypothetical protein BG006_005956 [Podila minutissima]
MSYDAVFDLVSITLEGTEISELDDMIEEMVNEQALLEDDSLEHPLFPSFVQAFPKRHVCPLRSLVTARQTIVEQEDVTEHRTDMANENSIQHWSPQLRTSTTILGSPLKNALARVPHRITTMAAMDHNLLVGGEDGSFTFMNLQTCQKPVFGTFTDGEYLEINSIEMSHSRTGASHAYVSTNDYRVRCVDLNSLETYAEYPTEWFVNYTAQSPDAHMIAIVGDGLDGQVLSVNSKEVIATLKGHQRFSFSCAWSPDSRMLATGSDDQSTCIYDTRKMSEPLHVLGSDIRESVRALRYSACGRYLVIAEERDYIHIVDTTSDYKQAQKIDFIGDISGISLTPDAEGLFVGVSSVDFSSLLEFERLYQGSDASQSDPWGSLY